MYLHIYYTSIIIHMYIYIYGCTCINKSGRKDGRKNNRAGVVEKQKYIVKMSPSKFFLLEGKLLKNF